MAPKPAGKTGKTSKSGTANAVPPLPKAPTQIARTSPSSPRVPNLPSNTPNIESSSTPLDGSAIDQIRDLMNKSLHITELKAWIDSHNVSTNAKNKRGMSSTPHKFAY